MDKFPAAFRIGVADADLQVIGEKYTLAAEGSEETSWRHFGLHSGKCWENNTPDEGVRRFDLWQDDIKLMAELGVRHYRTSISMARTMKRDGTPNGKGLEWYRRYFAALKAAGIAVYATLYHWELPQYLAKSGGWTNRSTIDALVRHAEIVHEHLGEHLSEIFVLNEPWCSSFLSWHLGIHAPGERDLGKAMLAAHHLLLAQGAIVRMLQRKDPSLKVSTVYNLQSCYAASPSEQDCTAAAYSNAYFNSWFLEPLFLGRYPEHLPPAMARVMPEFSREDLDEIRVGSRLHALGINYYRGDILQASAGEELNYKSITIPGGPANDLGWPIYQPPHYPQGLYDLLQEVYFSYRTHGLKRLYITENGMALKSVWDKKSDIVADERRVEFLKEHLRQVKLAIERGVPVEAYFFWTLMDNFEWAEGYRPESCFGLVHVDRSTMKRVKKQSAEWYSRFMKTGEL